MRKMLCAISLNTLHIAVPNGITALSLKIGSSPKHYRGISVVSVTGRVLMKQQYFLYVLSMMSKTVTLCRMSVP